MTAFFFRQLDFDVEVLAIILAVLDLGVIDALVGPGERTFQSPIYPRFVPLGSSKVTAGVLYSEWLGRSRDETPEMKHCS